MDNEPSPSPDVDRPPEQKTLKDIASAVGALSRTGEVSSTGNFQSKEYLLKSKEGWGNLNKVFVGQITQLGKKRFPDMQDLLVVLEGEEDVGRKEVSYQIYEDGGKYRVERYERTITETDNTDYPEDINIFEALEGATRKREGRKLEKDLGLTNIDVAEAQQLLKTLRKLLLF